MNKIQKIFLGILGILGYIGLTSFMGFINKTIMAWMTIIPVISWITFWILFALCTTYKALGE